MLPEPGDLETPWLREQLVENLRDLASPQWLDAALAGDGHQLDWTLDFFDDTGVVDEPAGRIGFILLDETEAAALARLGAALDPALDDHAAGAQSPVWQAVASAAQAVLDLFASRGRPPA